MKLATQRMRDWTAKNPEKRKYNNFVGHAKARKLEMKITYEQFCEYLNTPCFYCEEKSTGLDRKDNKQGYILENVLACCRRCNLTRNVFWTVEQTKAMITLALSMRGKK